MATDPICGMTVEPATAAGHFDHGGRTYYFCSTRCLDRFRAAPDQYVKTTSVATAAMPAAGRRSLPMMQTMPEMSDLPIEGGERDPVCGMTVQPATAAGSHAHAGKTYYFCCQCRLASE
ncbi:MAG TPA: YHS domain-containing protein [Nitrospira sp.]|nr:YHS domain-containing protein [Nitrospira sp.]